MTNAMADRVTELEVRVAFIEDSLASLGSTIAEHDRKLRESCVLLERLSADHRQLRIALAHDVHDEPPPPHY